MTDSNTAFSGSIPAIYDSALGPMFFEPYARDLARRLKMHKGDRVLEIAAGTGILTKRMLKRLPAGAELVATDLNDAMIEIGKGNVGPDTRVRWQQADAGALPFPDESFDAVVCQFGLMFFPDKIGALRQARRVLKPGGRLLLNTWGTLADNPIASRAHSTVASFFHTDPPPFFNIPFGLHDAEAVRTMLLEAGFATVDVDIVDLMGTSASALSAAKGLIFGTPVIHEIQERGGQAPDAIMHAVAERLSQEGGAQPMKLQMRALIFAAR